MPTGTTIVDIATLFLLACVCFGGVILTVTQLPGTWTIVVVAAAYTWLVGTDRLAWSVVLIVAGISAAAEIFEFASGAVMARRGGASRRAAWYGLAGGVLGAFLLSIPILLVGTVIGAVIGCFAGAFLAEMQEGRTLHDGARSGVYAALGRALGSIVKVMASVIMSSIVVITALLSYLR